MDRAHKSSVPKLEPGCTLPHKKTERSFSACFAFFLHFWITPTTLFVSLFEPENGRNVFFE
jgi:hypothetical protein